MFTQTSVCSVRRAYVVFGESVSTSLLPVEVSVPALVRFAQFAKDVGFVIGAPGFR